MIDNLINIIMWFTFITLMLIGIISMIVIWYCAISFIIHWYNDNLKYKIFKK